MSEIVDHWVAGWARSRDRQLERDGDTWAVRVGDGKRDLEYVVVSPSAAEAERLARLVATPGRWLTVLGDPDPEVARVLAALEPVSSVEMMMDVRLVAGVPDPDAVVTETAYSDGVARAAIVVDGIEAAWGFVALAGDTAVIDRVETDERFRRRGLGRRIIAALTAWAISRGADSGALIASPAGRRLYLSLGWADLLPVASYAGRPVQRTS